MEEFDKVMTLLTNIQENVKKVHFKGTFSSAQKARKDLVELKKLIPKLRNYLHEQVLKNKNNGNN
jgi:hypothetical protein